MNREPEAAISNIEFAGCASRASAHWSVSVPPLGSDDIQYSLVAGFGKGRVAAKPTNLTNERKHVSSACMTTPTIRWIFVRVPTPARFFSFDLMGWRATVFPGYVI
jgi:hypothetical protein